ncbi:MAG: YdiU family protein, partial [Ectothiorhodospiraceae bacterium]
MATDHSAATDMNPAATDLPFDNSYARLPERFYQHCRPTVPSAPQLLAFNGELAGELGLGALDEATAEQVLSGATVPASAEPLAMAYAGHQFGNFVPQLGDGRAILLGEVVDRNGVRRDIHLKGAGRTPFSRHGDGLCPIGPALREYLVSEAMHALGVPSSRALALVATGDTVLRETPQPGAVIARVAAGHVRVGTLQYFAARSDVDAVATLADYVLDRHYPALRDRENPYRELLEAVAQRQAALVADWMNLGFIHGVMNTDNMSLAGETLDYGPCAFMDTYHPGTVFSFVDEGGRYAYANQPRMARWNLTRFAECLLPLLDTDEDQAVKQAQAVIDAFGDWYEGYRLQGMRRKLGLAQAHDGDEALADDLLDALQQGGADFTLFFRRLTAVAVEPEADEPVRTLFTDPAPWLDWAERWRSRLSAEGGDPSERRHLMEAVNPAVIPRNHSVEHAIRAAEDHGDLEPFQALR